METSHVTFGEQTSTNVTHYFLIDVKFVRKICMTTVGFLSCLEASVKNIPDNFETRIDPPNRKALSFDQTRLYRIVQYNILMMCLCLPSHI